MFHNAWFSKSIVFRGTLMKKQVVLLLLCLSMGLLPVQGQSFSSDSIATGDLLFLDLDCGALCSAIEAVTPHYKGVAFSHVGLLIRKTNGQLLVIEATGDSVQCNPLEQVLHRSPHPAYVGQLRRQWKPLAAAAVAFAERQIGQPYDGAFLLNNGKYYCSELVYEAFKWANHNHPVFRLFPMTYKEPGESAYFPAWVRYFNSIHQAIPEGKPGCNPGSIAVSGKLRLSPLDVR